MKKLILLFALISLNFCLAQEDLSFQKPSPGILALADYEPAPSVSMDTRKNFMLLSYRPVYKSLDELNQPEMKLAGLRINPVTNISSTTSYIYNLKIRKIKDFQAEPIQVQGLPREAKIANVSWSPDDNKIAFTHTTGTGVELWVIDVASATARRISDPILNCNLGRPYSWYTDNQHLLVRVIPKDRPALIDQKVELPRGPIVTVAEGKATQNRTFQDLLKNKTDEHNFESLVRSEIWKVDLNGNKSLYKEADLYLGLAFSPDGNYILISKVGKPFSYAVPLGRFPQTSVVCDLQGKEIKIVNQVPLDEIRPKGFSAVRTGKRNMAWRDDKAASLYYVEALDGGDPAAKAEYRDELFSWDAPFTSQPVSLLKTKQRFAGVTWGNEKLAIAYDNWYDTRNAKTYLFDPSDPASQTKIIFDRNYQDIYGDPGNFGTRENQYNRDVLAVEKDQLFLIGEGHTAKGQFPFIDEFNLKTLQTKRIYQSSYTDKKEDILSIEDYKNGMALVVLQSRNEFPNYYFRNYRKKDPPQQITFQKNPFESIKNVEKQVIHYKRSDGVDLSGTLYLPLGYDKTKKEKLPLLIWAYPEEFKDKNSAGQSTKNPNEFTFPNYGSFVFYVTKGYAVLDDASFPIIGEGDKEPNDNFIEQLVANGRAAIDAVDRMGYIDRSKVAVGGHSYGAFMTANLLTHSPDFTCGIARSGAYNRTLTPFGFQSEQRNLWDAPEVYNGMSPFYTAHKMKKPILLVHGEADNNPGTFTLQTERYFQAIKGLGGQARMVILPKESHGYAARENILHLLWEQEQFLDKHLKAK